MLLLRETYFIQGKPLMNLGGAIVAAVHGQPAKIKAWTNYWDDPAHVRQAMIVGFGLLALFVLMAAYNRFDSSRKKRKWRSESSNKDSEYPDEE